MYITTSLVVSLQVFMLNIHGLSPILTAVPHWLRILVLGGIAPVLCIPVDFADTTHRLHQKPKKKKWQSKVPTDEVFDYRQSSLMSIAANESGTYRKTRNATSPDSTVEEEYRKSGSSGRLFFKVFF